MIKVAIAGVSGRMGQALLRAIEGSKNARDPLVLSAAIHKAGGSWVGRDANEIIGGEASDVIVSADLSEQEFDVLIDFSLPDSALENLAGCVARGKSMVIGTTGFTDDQLTRIGEASKRIPVVLAPNMSVGVNLCLYLLQEASKALGDSVDVEIIETHHRNKLDAPSGTALAMGQVIADSLERDLNKCAVHGREGRSDARSRETIGFSSIRAGDVVGDHTVLFAGEGERIELTHKASDRSIYATGALRAASWLSKQPAGLYSMREVLGLS